MWFKRNVSQNGIEVLEGWKFVESKRLPIGDTEFNTWATRIISSANVGASERSQKFVLANLILQLNNDEDFRTDEYFVSCLRKAAINETANSVVQQIKTEQLKEKEQAKEMPAADKMNCC